MPRSKVRRIEDEEEHYIVVERMITAGLAFEECIHGRGQCGYADLNEGGFYFLIRQRNKVATALQASGWDGAFLELVAYDENKDRDFVYFHRPYHVGVSEVTSLSRFVAKERRSFFWRIIALFVS